MSGWEIENTSGFEQKTITKTDKDGYGDYSLIISAKSNSDVSENNLSDWINVEYGPSFYFNSNEPLLTINGRDATRFYEQPIGGGIPTENLFIIDNKTLFHFTCLVSFDGYPDYSKYKSSGKCDEIINSFKFVK